MILSFHPCVEVDVNVIVAGRAPEPEEKALVKRADAIILPQGVRQDLYYLSPLLFAGFPKLRPPLSTSGEDW